MSRVKPWLLFSCQFGAGQRNRTAACMHYLVATASRVVVQGEVPNVLSRKCCRRVKDLVRFRLIMIQVLYR